MKIVAAGTNPVQLCRGIEHTVWALVKDLEHLSTDVTDADLANVATVSAGGNEVVSFLLCQRLLLLAVAAVVLHFAQCCPESQFLVKCFSAACFCFLMCQ